MKNTIIFILQIIILGIVSSCEKNEEGITFVDFSDNVFYEWCLSSFDLDGDQELSFRELYLVTEMNIPAQYNGQTIKSLGGIENFAYLEQLTCSDNTELTSLDLSKCSYLKKADCHNCNISSLNLSGCSRLEELYCYSNSLNELNLSDFESLAYLYCDFNVLTSLDFTNNPDLKEISCSGNKLQGDLNLSKCTKLEALLCEKNSIELIDITECTSLKTLICYSNKLTAIDVYSKALEILSCSGNDISWLHVANCENLQELYCSENPSMQILGIKGCVSLKTLECYSNNLSSLNMSDSKDLTHIDCHNNVLSSITLNSTLITYLDVSQNLLQTLDISLCPAIKCLYFTLNRPLNNIYVNENIDVTNLRNVNGEAIDLGGGDKSVLQYK